MKEGNTLSKIEEAKDILVALGLPKQQQNEISALTLLSLCEIEETTPWSEASRRGKTITKDIMKFIADKYGKEYAPNTRETFRRQVLHQFIQAKISDYNPFIKNPATNSPKSHYAISEEALFVIKAYGTPEMDERVDRFIAKNGTLTRQYEGGRSHRQLRKKIGVLVDNKQIMLSPGKHNVVQKAVIEEFLPRFVRESDVLYLGDTDQKGLFLRRDALGKTGVEISEHDKLPDIIVHDTIRDCLFLFEVVTSHGPVTPKRIIELEELFSKSKKKRIYISAFPDLNTYRAFIREIAWETEVWIAEIPDHMLHYNGDHFLIPR